MQTNLLTILEPFNRCVYQRDNEGFSNIPVMGTAPAGTTSVTVQLTPVNGGTAVTQTVAVDMAGNYGGNVRAVGGWYSLTVSAADLMVSVNRVGSGEVFVKFGHSFMDGGHDASNQKPATDERAITLLDNMDAVQYQFGQLLTSVGPANKQPDMWGPFADLLVRRLNVPVLVYGCAYGGSSLEMSLEVINGQTLTKLPPGYTGLASRMPFAMLERVLSSYIPKTGIRAILVEHGYNDRGISSERFQEVFKGVFDYVRNTYNMPELSVVLVQEQLSAVTNTLYDIPTANGQRALFTSYPNLWRGPDFNGSDWLGLFAVNNHLFGPALTLFARQWADSISADLLAGSTPYGPRQIDVFPSVLYMAPTTDVKLKDWFILGAAALVLILLFIKRSNWLMWAFLLLGLLGLGRVTNKV